MWKFLAASLLMATTALAQENPTAYDALRAVGNQLGRDSVNRVISVTGVGGDPQPETWKILLEDRQARGGVREVEVRGGRFAGQRTPVRTVAGSTEGATIDTSKLNLDSSGAFSVASHTAETSHVSYATVSYTLRTDDRSNPVWVVTLNDDARHAVGTIHIGANRGTVVRTEGMFHGAGMNQVVEDRRPNRDARPPPDYQTSSDESTSDEDAYYSEEGAETQTSDADDDDDDDDEDDADENVVKRNIKGWFRRTRDEASRLFDKVNRPFEDFFYRD